MRRTQLKTTTLAVLLGIGAAGLAACAGGGEDIPDQTVPVPGDDTGAPADDTGAPADDTGTPTTAPPTTDSGTTTTPPADTGTTPPADTGTPPADSAPPPTPGTYDYASGLAVSEIAVFQGVKVSLWKGGAAASHVAPVVAGRPGLVRVYVAPQAGWAARAVTGQLTLTSGGAAQTYSDTKTLSGASTDATLASTFDFDLPATAFNADTTATVELTVPKGTGAAAGGSAMVSGVGFAADNPGSTLKIVFVPVKYMADGSGRLPDTSAAQMAIYQQTMMKLYPAKSITITLHAPWSWSSTISATGSGFDTILNSLSTLRQTDKAPADTYYFAAFDPSSSFNTFCGGGCVAGLSTVASSATDSFARVSTGLGYTGVDSAMTMAHEVGHAHGRNHSPTKSGGVAQCSQPSGTDASYPYTSGLIGTWGYDIGAKTMFNPANYGDIMGYCQSSWISDYTYRAFFARMKAVTGGADIFYPAGAPTKFRLVAVGIDGSLTWGETVEPMEPPVGELTTYRYVGVDGSTISEATGHFYPYSDLPGGLMLVPEGGPEGWHAIAIDRLPNPVKTIARDWAMQP
jgi:hypothetical protein